MLSIKFMVEPKIIKTKDLIGLETCKVFFYIKLFSIFETIKILIKKPNKTIY